MDYRNSLNPLDKNTVIYGHHIGDQTMFDVLDDYLKQSFYDKHKSIHFDTKYGKYQLQILVHLKQQVMTIISKRLLIMMNSLKHFTQNKEVVR